MLEKLTYDAFMDAYFDFTFDSFIKFAPPTVSDYGTRLKFVPQSYNWHPEGNVEIHTKIVLNRTYASKDPDICFAAFYHDLGKVDKTVLNDKGGYSAHEHEDVSAHLVKYSRDWIKEHANPDCVEWIVKNHMRAKYLDSMKSSKKKALKDHIWFPKLEIFLKCDSREGLNPLEVRMAGGNVFKYWINKIRTLFDK